MTDHGLRPGENPEEWVCECQAANPITRGRCWLCSQVGRVLKYLYPPPEPPEPQNPHERKNR